MNHLAFAFVVLNVFSCFPDFVVLPYLCFYIFQYKFNGFVLNGQKTVEDVDGGSFKKKIQRIVYKIARSSTTCSLYFHF